jgi:hypothetical protein
MRIAFFTGLEWSPYFELGEYEYEANFTEPKVAFIFRFENSQIGWPHVLQLTATSFSHAKNQKCNNLVKNTDLSINDKYLKVPQLQKVPRDTRFWTSAMRVVISCRTGAEMMEII